MAHFAKLDENNRVLAVHAVDDTNCSTEQEGIDFLKRIYGWEKWKQTSYNTACNKHYRVDHELNKMVLSDDQSKAFRGNFAGVGYTYNETHNIFMGEKPHSSWTLDLNNANWVSPIVFPTVTTYVDGENTINYEIKWDETNSRWTALNENNDSFIWNTSTSSWDSA